MTVGVGVGVSGVGVGVGVCVGVGEGVSCMVDTVRFNKMFAPRCQVPVSWAVLPPIAKVTVFPG